jgi:hypothetical protein
LRIAPVNPCEWANDVRGRLPGPSIAGTYLSIGTSVC